ncbi:MAG: hypothetical protein ABR536_06590 [Solirubrobacterales bacterium]
MTRFDAATLARRAVRALQQLATALRGPAKRAALALRLIVSLPIAVAATLLAFLARIGGVIGQMLGRAGEWVQPEWVVAAVAIGCAAALGLSQFVHYTGVAVDAGAYAGKIGTVAPAPVAQVKDAGSAHFYVLLPIAAVAIGLTFFALRGNWRVGRLVSFCGLVGIAVSLIVDLPKGLDAGQAGVAYNGAKAELSDGFYAQLAAAAMLFVSGAVLSSLLHQRQPNSRRPRRRLARRTRRERQATVPVSPRSHRGASA